MIHKKNMKKVTRGKIRELGATPWLPLRLKETVPDPDPGPGPQNQLRGSINIPLVPTGHGGGSFFGQKTQEHVKTIKNIVWRSKTTFFVKMCLNKKICFS